MSNEQNNASPVSKFIEQANALLRLDDANALVPHGIGGFARELLTEAIRLLSESTAPTVPQDEPFGYFRVDALGWTDCAATDEGAIALYERPAAPAVPDTHISVQEAWEAAGGNPGIKASKADLIIALKTLDTVCDEADAAPAVPQGEPVDFDSIIADIEAIDCVYRGDPSYDYDPRDIREQAANVVRHHATHYVTPAAPSQPVTLTDGLIEKGAMTGMVDAQIDAIITALREKGKA